MNHSMSRLIRKFIDRLILPPSGAKAFPDRATTAARLGDNCRYVRQSRKIFLDIPDFRIW